MAGRFDGRGSSIAWAGARPTGRAVRWLGRWTAGAVDGWAVRRSGSSIAWAGARPTGRAASRPDDWAVDGRAIGWSEQLDGCADARPVGQAVVSSGGLSV